MSRCIRCWPFIAGLIVAAPWIPTEAPAQAPRGPKDAAVTKLADDAMNVDYLGMKFGEAEKKLRRGLTTCGANGCSPQVKAKLERCLGVVLVAGLNKPDEGRAAFVEALKLDPGGVIDKDFSTPEIEKAWQAAKGGGEGGAEASAGEAGAEDLGGGAPAGGGGELLHKPPMEQVNLTPVPIFVDVPSALGASRVMVRYKPFGGDWKKIEAQKMTKGYGIEIPCADVGSATGDLVYYIEALDSNGEPIATSGTRARPHKVPIKNELAGEPPHLPGRPPSARCADAADCPPGLPGCKSKKVGGKSWGDKCDFDGECAEGLQCTKGVCEAGPGGATKCDADSDCDPGQTCSEHVCEGASEGGARKNWLSVAVQQDFSLIGKDTNICAPEGRSALYECIAMDGYAYWGEPSTESGNRVENSGFSVANTRVLLGYDRLVSDNVTVGIRAGYAFNSAPSAISFHGEARAAYWFGQKPFAVSRVRPFAGVIGGMAEVDVKLKVPIIETMTDARDYNEYLEKGDAANNSFGAYYTNEFGDAELTVWRRTRNIFAGVAGGVMIPIGGPRQGIIAEVKAFMLFPNSGFSLSPSVGYGFGF